MSLRRMAKLTGETVVSYVHNAAAPGMGKIGVLVAFTGGDEGFARQVAMHVAAVNPAALNEAELDPADRREGKAGPDGHRPRKRQARAGDREDDRRPDEEIPGRGHAAEPAIRGEPRPDRRRRRERGRRRDHRLRPARGRRRHRGRRKTSPPRSPRPSRADATGSRARSAGRMQTRGREILPRAFRLPGVRQKKKNGTAEGQVAVPFSPHARKVRGHRARVGIKGDTTGEIARGGAPPTRNPDAGVATRLWRRSTRCSWQSIAITRGTPSLCDFRSGFVSADSLTSMKKAHERRI
jgi:hypothetical protein